MAPVSGGGPCGTGGGFFDDAVAPSVSPHRRQYCADAGRRFEHLGHGFEPAIVVSVVPTIIPSFIVDVSANRTFVDGPEQGNPQADSAVTLASASTAVTALCPVR